MSTRRAVLALAIGTLLGLLWGLAGHYAHARNIGQWEDSPKEIREWFQSLKQPDTGVSCCGEADGYWADTYYMDGDNLVAEVDDDRDDTILGRQHVPPGTKFVIPKNKLVDITKYKGNPTGHSVIFLGYWSYSTFGGGGPVSDAEIASRRPVLCFIPGSGT